MFRSIGKLVKVGKLYSKIHNAESESDRQIAAQYLAELFANERGILLKIGQFMASNNEAPLALQQLGRAHVEKTDQNAVLTFLETLWHRDPTSVISEISDYCLTASLSRVYMCRLRETPGKWALKIQLPEVRKNIDSLLQVLGLLPNLGPGRKYGMDLNEYKTELRATLDRELDYSYEQKVLTSLHSILKPGWIRIPQTVPGLCTNKIMVLEYFDGCHLEEIAAMGEDIRKLAAERMVHLFLHQLSQWTYFQSDWNPGNLLFKIQGNQLDLQVIDFGSFYKLTDLEKAALHSLFKKIQNKQIHNCIEELQSAGFSSERLHMLADNVDAVVSALFAPFLSNVPFDLESWNYTKEIDQQLGEMKWWFRSAGTPQMFHFVRAYAMLMQNLKKLNTKINFREILLAHEFKGQEFPVKRTPAVSATTNADPSANWKSHFLKVRVSTVRGEELVFITMPIYSIHHLEDCLPEEALENIVRRGIPLLDIKDKFFKEQGPAGVLFELTEAQKIYKVWSE